MYCYQTLGRSFPAVESAKQKRLEWNDDGKWDALNALRETERRQEKGYQNIWTLGEIMSFPSESHFRKTDRKLIELCAAAPQNTQNTDAQEHWYGTNVKIFCRNETNPHNYLSRDCLLYIWIHTLSLFNCENDNYEVFLIRRPGIF